MFKEIPETENSLIQRSKGFHLSFLLCMYLPLKKQRVLQILFLKVNGLLKELNVNYKQKLCNKRSSNPNCWLAFLIKELQRLAKVVLEVTSPKNKGIWKKICIDHLQYTKDKLSLLKSVIMMWFWYLFMIWKQNDICASKWCMWICNQCTGSQQNLRVKKAWFGHLNLEGVFIIFFDFTVSWW